MAMDVALMARAARTGEAVLRVYTWATPVLSFGRNQTALGWYDPGRLAAMQIGAVRRPTGGRAILHHREVTYSVTAPLRPALSIRAFHARVNALLLHALHALGVAAEAAPRPVTPTRPTAAPCFERPAAGELVAGGRKLVGSAQWRDDGAVLQHGSILVDDDQRRLPLLMMSPPATELAAPATLHALLGRRPAAGELATALGSAVRALEDPAAEPLDPDAVRDAATAHVARFRDPAWTWRR